MKKLKTIIVLIIAKLAAFGMNLLRHPANNYPGALAMRLMPDIWHYISYPKTKIFITGSNGKTSSTNLAYDLFTKAGYSVVCNTNGRNMAFGILTTIIKNSSIFGKCRGDYLILETGEESIGEISHNITPDFILVSNLQRDNIERSPSPEYVLDWLKRGIIDGPHFILNGDDLVSSQLSVKGPSVFYRIEPQENEKMFDTLVKDLPVCPVCGAPMKWEFTRSQTIGQGHCTRCDFGSPKCRYIMEKVDDKTMQIAIDGISKSYPAVGTRMIDHYNCLGVIALGYEAGLSYEQICHSLKSMKIVAKRYIEKHQGNHVIYASMAKGWNPVAVSSTMLATLDDPNKKTYLFLLDDKDVAKTGTENISYSYDSDFELLDNDKVENIYVLGKRCHDIAIRMLLADIPQEKIHCYIDIYEGTRKAKLPDAGSIYFIYDQYYFEDILKMVDIVSERLREEGK